MDITALQRNFHLLNPREIKRRLDQYVIGQESAKKQLSVAAYKHLQRVAMILTQSDKELPAKSNVVLIGPTGVGKTYLVHTLARILCLPMASVDVTTISSSGLIGDSINIIADHILSAAKNSLGFAELGIVFLDEIDKLCNSESTAGGRNIQYELLRVLEGRSLAADSHGRDTTEVNTSNILFIAGGSFHNEVHEEVYEEEGANVVGFGAGEIKKTRIPINDQLVQYGLIPELVGRFQTGAVLTDLDVSDLVKIMKSAKESIVKNFIELFKHDNKKLVFTKGALEAVAEVAIEKGTGARAINSVLELALNDLQFNLLGDGKEETIKIKKKDILRKIK